MKPIENARRLLSSLTGVPVDRIPSDASISTFPDWDSIVHMELIVVVESRLARELNDEEMASLISVEAIAQLLNERLNGAAT